MSKPRMMKVPFLLATLIMATGLSGCGMFFGDDGIFRDRGHDYRKAKLRRPLKIPAGVKVGNVNDSYPVPGLETYRVLAGEFDVPRPDLLISDAQLGSVRIQKLDDARWILSRGTPGEVWPRLRGYLTVEGIPLARTDAVRAVLETSWHKPKDAAVPQERYQLRIERGVQRGSSEIYIKHADRRSPDYWPQVSSNIEREERMVRRLAQYLADTEAASSVSMVAQRASGDDGKISLEEGRNFSFLRLELPMNRAWASLGSGLRKAGFEVLDWDRTSGRYSIRPGKKSDEEDGWFKRIFGSRNPSGEAYFVDIRPNGPDIMIITIRGQDRRLNKRQTEELLKRIKGFIT